MAGVANSVDVDLFNEMQMQGDSEVQTKAVSTNPQIAFIQKCIHPPSALPGYLGIPTNDARSQVCLEWRRMNLNNTPYFYDFGTSKVRAVLSADLGQFDYAFLHVNGCRVMSIPFIYNVTKNTMTQDLNNVQTISQYNWKQWHVDANLHRVVYKSTTHTLNATAFNNTGIVVGNQFNPSLLFVGVASQFADSQPTNFRRWVKDMLAIGHFQITSDAVERETYNTFPKHIREDVNEFCSLKSGTALNINPDAKIQILNLGAAVVGAAAAESLVPSNDAILQNSLRSYGGKALEGAFSVQRLNTIAPAWCNSSNTVNTVSAPFPGLFYCYSYDIGTDGAGHFVAFTENAAIGDASTALKTLQDTMWTSDMTMSWVKFSGLSLNPTAGTAGYPSTQLMAIKQYIGIEVQPTPISAWSAMMKLGPKPDLQSLQALMDGFYELKDVLPARYNFWGTLGSIAAQGLKTFGSSILENLMKGGGSKSESTSKNRKSKKEVAEVRDVDHKEDAVNKKLDMLMSAFTKSMQVRGKSASRKQRRPPTPKPRGRSRAPPVKQRRTVLPPGQVNQSNPPASRSSRRSRSRKSKVD